MYNKICPFLLLPFACQSRSAVARPAELLRGAVRRCGVRLHTAGGRAERCGGRLGCPVMSRVRHHRSDPLRPGQPGPRHRCREGLDRQDLWNRYRLAGE